MDSLDAKFDECRIGYLGVPFDVKFTPGPSPMQIKRSSGIDRFSMGSIERATRLTQFTRNVLKTTHRVVSLTRSATGAVFRKTERDLSLHSPILC